MSIVMMNNNEVNVIWKKGDGEMPEKARYVVEAAQSELLLKAVVNTIR